MDDEEMVREIASGILDRFGHETLHAADGEEAIKIYQREKSQGRPIDLVIMDLTIPGAMGGKEAITQLLHIDSEARVIVSSGYANDPVMANYREYGFVAAIQKPFQLSELIWIVEQSLKE
jgi:CheY-like chemotaxis protein